MIWLLDFSVKTGVLLGAAWCVSLLLRRASADVRHSLWVAAFLGVVILALPLHVPQPVRIAAPVQFAITSLGGALETPGRSWTWSPWTAVWMAGMVVTLARLLAGIATVALWTRKARHSGPVLVSDRAATPLTWGVFRPVILFPAYAEKWPFEQRDLALRHEQAHIARKDWLWQTLANAIRAVFWFHPLVWLAEAEMRLEAERAADDMVLASGADASGYAGQLVQAARSLTGAAPAAVVAMVRGRVLESRVREILDPLRKRGRATIAARAAVAAVICACLVPLLAMQDRSVLRSGVSGDGSGVRDAGGPSVMSETPAIPVVRRPSAAPSKRETSDVPAVDFATHKLDEPGMKAPRLLYKQEPAYTEDARAARIQGTVVLSVVIDAQGRAEDVQVIRSLDPGLDEQAILTVGRWQFAPGMKDGEPVRVNATIEINFRLL